MAEIEYTIDILPQPIYTMEMGPQGPQGATGPQGIQGETGPAGADGEDGFSPIVTVEQEEGVTTITAIDKDGTTSASITIPTLISDLTNDSGYITSSDLSGYATETWVGNQGFAHTTDIPTATSDLQNDSGFITGITSSDVTTALGYTPYDSSNPNGYTSNAGTVTSVNNVSPINGNVTLTIPSEVTETTVSNWGFTKNTGTVTSVNNVSPVSGNVTLTIPTVPTNISAFNNDSGYITGINSSDVTTALGYTPYNSSNPSGYITSSAITNMQTTGNLVTSVSSSSTDSQYPSAKLFYDTCGDIETLINNL